LDKTNYNHFTIRYIEAIRFNLKIEIVNGETLFFPDFILPEDIANLQRDLDDIWLTADSAIEVAKNRTDSKIQSGLFGLFNEFDLAIRTGFLMGDRVILLDYLYERLLKNKSFETINIEQLGSIGVNLVSTLELAKKGRIVIIPSPFYWHKPSKDVMIEAARNTSLTPAMLSLLNTLSITRECQLHPYTVAESTKNFELIINEQIDLTQQIGKDAGDYAYQGILGALLTEKLFNEIEFTTASNIPLEKFHEVVISDKEFYDKFLNDITAGGSLNADNNLLRLKNSFIESIQHKNKNSAISHFKKIGVTGGIGSGLISLIGSASIISPTLGTLGAIMGLSSTLFGLLKSENRETNSIISVFKKLNNK
jgi:hypothetical protein